MKKLCVLVGLYLLSMNASAETKMAALRVNQSFDHNAVRCKNMMTNKPVFHPAGKKYTVINVLGPGKYGPFAGEWAQLQETKGYSNEELGVFYVQFRGLSIQGKQVTEVSGIGRPEFSDHDQKIRIPLANNQVANLRFYRTLPKIDPYNPPKYSPYFFKFWFDGDTAVQDCRLEYEPWGG